MSVEGRRAVEILSAPGLWRRAGMDGRVCGLDWGAAFAMAPQIDRDRLTTCLQHGEAATLAALSEREEKHDG